jgi:hypothetical protein
VTVKTAAEVQAEFDAHKRHVNDLVGAYVHEGTEASWIALTALILPDPVDPLLQEAREACAETNPSDAEAYLAGDCDGFWVMRTVLTALRRRDAKEGRS